MQYLLKCFVLIMIWLVVLSTPFVTAEGRAQGASDLDAQVSRFLNDNHGSWSYWNVPYQDGKILYDLVVKGGFKNILEIGTSTGHSTIWLAWAASKTGGTVTTVEIDKGRHETARKNFKKAGVESYIDARLGDAHKVVPSLRGPFDFVFCDADKDWYLQYFKDVRQKIPLNGCFTAHNVLWSSDRDIKKFLEYAKRDAQFRTTIERGSGEGISISCRISEP
ncbi:MAG TPA: class I SAM-dependent methyltransferase [Syntrophorhabdales bacterium]|nr:class I SAM-dependent methyltransferase [Syntrophorhabdales bacterium]